MTKEEKQKLIVYIQSGRKVKDPELQNLLTLESQVVRTARVHNRTKSKKLIRYQIVAVSGNPEIGCFGIGLAKNLEYGVAIREAIKKSKKRLKIIQKGCGFRGCPCENQLKHSIPHRRENKVGSTLVKLIPASLKTGIRTSPTGRKLLELAGVSDLMVVTRGNKNNRLNIIKAIYGAL